MPTTSTGLLQRASVHRSPNEGSYTLVRPRAAGVTPRAGLGETDFYLRRSYAIVEVLRRAVADRGDFDAAL